MLKFSEIFEFSKQKFRKIPILKEFEWFEWFGPSPIEPFNSALRRELRAQLRDAGAELVVRELLQVRPAPVLEGLQPLLPRDPEGVGGLLRRLMNKSIESPRNFERLVLGCIDVDFCK